MEPPVRLESWDDGAVTICGTGRPNIKKKGPPSSGKYGFNIKFIKGLWSLLYGDRKDLSTLLVLLATIILNLYVGSISGKVTGQFYKVIVDKDLANFKTVLWKSAVVVVFSAILESEIKVLLDIIGYRWRKALVKHIHGQYFNTAMYYQILHLDHTIDNPDQRITQDLDAMTKTLATVLRALIESPLTIAYYGYLSIKNVTWYSPLLVVGYWLVAFLVNKLLMNPSAAAVFRQEQLEGNFRFGHLRIRTFAESIAMYGGSGREKEIAETSFTAVLKNRLRLIKWESCITLSTNIFAYFAAVLNYAIISLPIFQGWKLPESAGSAAEYFSVASFQLIMLINGFTTINNASRDMSDFIGYSNRIAQMLEVMKKLKKSELTQHLNQPQSSTDNDGATSGDDFVPSGSLSPESIDAQDPQSQNSPQFSIQTIASGSGFSETAATATIPTYPSQHPTSHRGKKLQEVECVEFRDFSAYTPSGQALIKNLSLQVPKGQSLFITGPSGSGKTSLLRCLSGLWRSFDGEIDRPSSVLFLPQRPYMPFGSLQDQVRYPLAAPDALLSPGNSGNLIEPDHIDPALLLSILKDVELDHLINRPHAYGAMTPEAREAMRDLINDQDNEDVLSESTKLLMPGGDTSRQRLLDIIDQMEASNLNWTEVLSPGEQQRIGLARVLLHRPRFVILDEATSNVDEAMEAKFYRLCREYNITAITVGHKSSLRQHHERTLVLDRRGGWQLN